MPRLFDAYVMVDWSAASTPKRGKDSIWIAAAFEDAHGRSVIQSWNPPTRAQAQAQLVETLDMLSSNTRPTLLGFDFALGYPAGTAAALGLDQGKGPAWHAMFDHLSTVVRDGADNSNDRFELAADLNRRISGGPYPFWGAPHQTPDHPNLPKRKSDRLVPAGALPEQRLTEKWVGQTFPASPKSVWQIAYTGAVGSQVLLGIPTVARLRNIWPQSRIWPFETGLDISSTAQLDGVSCLIAEIYPSVIPVKPALGDVRDELQVRTLAQRFREKDQEGQLVAGFSARNSTFGREIEKIEQEEGWILAI